jgi:hypothetical protein
VTADFGPCSDWVPYWTCDEYLTASPALTGYAVAMATRVLWSLSGRRFGTCQVTLRPCRQSCYDSWPWGWSEWDLSVMGTSVWSDYRYWFPLSCGTCLSGCSCSQVSETVLPSPVSSVVQVKMDGTPMATGAYRVDNNRLLVRTDGQQWPQCNDLNKADTEAGTWSVTARYGEDVPQGANFATGELACEIIKAAKGEDCRLPPGVISLARQGVTIQYPDVGQLLKEGRTGLYLVDLFLSSENPGNLRQRARVYSVDRPTVRRTNT